MLNPDVGKQQLLQSPWLPSLQSHVACIVAQLGLTVAADADCWIHAASAPAAAMVTPWHTYF